MYAHWCNTKASQLFQFSTPLAIHNTASKVGWLLQMWSISKNLAWKYCLSFAKVLEVNIQHSIRERILFPYIAYMHDDLCGIIKVYFPSFRFGKGCRIIRRAEFLEVRYVLFYCYRAHESYLAYTIIVQEKSNVHVCVPINTATHFSL